MSFSSSDIEFSLVEEVTPNATPATPALKRVNHTPNSSLNYLTDMLASPVMMPNRAAGTSAKVKGRAEAEIGTHLHRTDSVDLLLASALSGKWTEAGDVGEDGDVLKAGFTDTSFTVEKKTGKGSAAYYTRARGCQASAFTISGAAGENVEANFTILGLSGEKVQTAITGATYADTEATTKLLGRHAVLTIAGISIPYSTFEFSSEITKEVQYVLGDDDGVGIASSGSRTINLNVTGFRKDLTPETLFSGEDTFEITLAIISNEGDGYTFVFPAAQANNPQDAEETDGVRVSMEFTASFDNVEQTDLKAIRHAA